MRICGWIACGAATVCIAACVGGEAQLKVQEGMGPAPLLPPPSGTLVPVVNVAPAVGWPDGVKPNAAEGTTVAAFADELDHPRWLYVLPNGDVLVAETNAPPQARGRQGHQGLVHEEGRSNAPARRCRARIASRCCAMPTATASPRSRSGFSAGLNSPFGMALVGNHFYVANTDALVRFPYTARRHRASPPPGAKVADLPGGPLNHHWTKNVIANRDGSQAVRDGGLQQQRRRARHGQGRGARRDLRSRSRRAARTRVFASGLRNPNGLAWEPQTGALWTVVNERDELGSDLVPDY